MALNCFSQTDTIKAKKEISTEEIYSKVEEMAEFPGGVYKMGKFIQKKFKYPRSARKLGVEGKCFLKFVVDEKGNITNVEVLKGVEGCSECNEEAIRVVKLMPKWKPAKIDGKPVKCYLIFLLV